MNLEETLSRLPPRLRDLLALHPAYAERVAQGVPLEQALASPDEPQRWAERASPVSRWLLRRIVRTYGCLPFEEAALERLAAESPWTGAEIRVALAGLLREGIVFAVRKTWGDRLLYLPADRAALWQLALYPRRPQPLPGEEQGRVSSLTAGSRLPLSLELLRTLAGLERDGGLPLTARGAPHKARAAKLAAGLGLTADDVRAAGLAFARPEGVPEQAALVLDIALRKGWLRRLSDRWEAAREPFGGGAAGAAPQELDAELLDLVAAEYGGAEAELHFAATALRALEPGVWYAERETLPPEATPRLAAAHGRWLKLMAALGWMERGRAGRGRAGRGDAGGEPVCRWLIDPRPAPLRDGPPPEPERPVVQPDGEIWAPPETGMAARWTLELLAERSAADPAVFTYRLTRESCLRAFERGVGLDEAKRRLEAVAGAPLPHAVALAIDDWFGRFGRLSLGQATLLRTDDPELAERLRRDAVAGPLLRERLGDGAFVVAPGEADKLAARLRELGYPPAPAFRPSEPAEPSEPSEPAAPAAPESPAAPAAWPAAVISGRGLQVYEPDDRIPAREQLFPGLESVPASWHRQAGRYHVSTRRKLVEQALAWRTALQVTLEGEAEPRTFIPETLEAAGTGWRVAGRFRDGCSAGERLVLGGETLAELKIELPEVER